MVSLPASLFSATCRPPTLSFPHLPACCGIVHLCDDADMQYWMDGPGHFVFKVLYYFHFYLFRTAAARKE